MTADYDSWMQSVQQWRESTAHVPVLLREDIIKGKYRPKDPARGFQALLEDPLSVQYSMGYKDRKYSLTYDTLKQVVNSLSILSAIINTRVHQVSSFSVPFRSSKSLGFVVKHKDPGKLTTKGEREMIQELERFIYNAGADKPNPHNTDFVRDDFETFLKKIVRDSLMYDQCCAEIVPDRSGRPYEFMAVDASTIRIAAPNNTGLGPNNTWHDRPPPILGSSYRTGTNVYSTMRLYSKDPSKRPAYAQVINGQIERVFTRDEMMFGVRNPRTDVYVQGYGWGEIEQLISIITSHLYAEEYNRRFFMQGSAPKGIINIKGDAMTPDQLEAFRRQWRANLEGVENCLSGDTRIYTKEHGFSSISDICGDKEEVPVHIWTGISWETGLVYRTAEPKILCHTSLSNGTTLSTSPDHKIRVVGDHGPEWREQKDLKIGDTVLINKKSPDAGTELMCFGKPVTPEFMEVMGWLLGDGSVDERAVRWFYHSSKEEHILDRHLQVIQEYFPKAVKKVTNYTQAQREHTIKSYGFKSVADRHISIHLNDTEAVRWLVSHGFTTQDMEKAVPPHLYTMPPAYVEAYLRGLFSADGCCAKGRSPVLSIRDSRLRDSIKHLLLSLGIRCSLSEGKSVIQISGRERYRVPGKSVLRVMDRDDFFDRIGFIQDHKQPVPLKRKNEANKSDKLPQGFIKAQLLKVRSANKQANYTLLTKRERMDLNSILSGSDGCSKNRLLRFMKKAGLEVPSWLFDFGTAQVVSVHNTGLYVPMFDVSVDHPDHFFMGENTYTSNSWRTPILQSEQGVDWINLSQSNRDMEYGQWLEYLIKVTCGVFLIDPAELNFDLHGGVSQTPLFESSQEWKLKASRDRGLRPLLRFIAKLINDNIIAKIDDHFVFDFVGLDELTEKEKHELRKEQVASYLTLNEIRRAEDLPDVEGGELILNPVYLQALQVKQQLEQQKQQGQPGQGAVEPKPAEGQQGGEEEPEQGPEDTPQYADTFTKSVTSDTPILEVSLDEYDSWLDLIPE